MDTDSHRTLRGRAVRTLAAAALTLAGPAFGQGASEDMASARVLGTEGVRLADSGDCRGAAFRLEAAEKLFHAPTTLERLGECQVSLGHVVAGTESLNRVLREPLSPTAPQAFIAARERAQRALAAALLRIAKLRIHVDGATLDALTVTVDGANVPSALLDTGRPTDPGNHEVKVSAAGYRPAVALVTLHDGAEASVALKLEVDSSTATPVAPSPGATSALVPAETGPMPPPSSPSSSGGHRGVAFGALAVGGAGLAVGSVFGALALASKSSLDSACSNNKTCPASSQGDIDALGSRATISTIAFGVGIVGAAVGMTLLVISGHGEEHARAPAKVMPWVGLATAGVEGTFE